MSRSNYSDLEVEFEMQRVREECNEGERERERNFRWSSCREREITKRHTERYPQNANRSA